MTNAHSTDQPPLTPRFSHRTNDIASDGAAGWAIADQAAAAIERGEDVISLCLGDTSFDTPQRIVDRAISSLREGRTHYAPVPGTPELRRAVAASQGRFDGQSWTENEVTIFAGGQNALFASLMCIAGYGDEILYFEPWYATYEATIRASGAIAKPVRMAFERPVGRILEQRIREAVTARTRGLLINAPNNPGGYLFDEAEIAIIAAIAEEHNLWIISDEVYRSYIFDGVFTSPASLHRVRDRTIIVNSVSKSNAMTGWRLGWTLAPAEASLHLQNLAQCMLFGSPTFIQDAACVALGVEGEDERAFFAAQLKQRRDLMYAKLLAMPLLRTVRPAGGMFCLVDVSETGYLGTEFCQTLFETQRLALVPGRAFGPNMENYVRISFSGSEAAITDGMERLRLFVASDRCTA